MTQNAQNALIYLTSSLNCIPRLLGLLNRNPFTSTYGCFDRNYWHYKITDFSNGRLQEAALTLALLYTINHPLNSYYGLKKMRTWSLAAVKFLTHIQNKDGSFNEYYPHEHAFVTTAFAAFAASETLLLLKETPPDALEMLLKAGKFLLKKDELEVVNQNLGACAALTNLYNLTNDEQFKKGAHHKLETSLKRQSKEGWFYEYGGPDIGYLSVALYYLAHYYQKTHAPSALTSLKKGVHFLSHFLHPDNTSGGEYGSRNTTYIVPDGIEICAQEDAYASQLADSLRASLHQKVFTPDSLDDRYLLTMLYTYIQAYTNSSPLPEKKTPQNNFFQESGLLVQKTPHYYFVANLKKGGIFKAFFHNTHIADSGFVGISQNHLVTSQWLGSSFTKKGSTYTVTGSFVRVPEQEMTPLKSVFMRASLSVGRSSLSRIAKTYLRKQLITQKNSIPCTFERSILIDKNICVTDTLKGDIPFTSLHLVDHASLIYIPSSRYFTPNEMSTPQFITEDLSEEFNKKKKIIIERTIFEDI
jgi:hypothetical protein